MMPFLILVARVLALVADAVGMPNNRSTPFTRMLLTAVLGGAGKAAVVYVIPQPLSVTVSVEPPAAGPLIVITLPDTVAL